jgi:hypothetical protein
MAEEDHRTNQTAAPPSIEELIEGWWATISRARQSPAIRQPGISPTPPRRGLSGY